MDTRGGSGREYVGRVRRIGLGGPALGGWGGAGVAADGVDATSEDPSDWSSAKLTEDPDSVKSSEEAAGDADKSSADGEGDGVRAPSGKRGSTTLGTFLAAVGGARIGVLKGARSAGLMAPCG